MKQIETCKMPKYLHVLNVILSAVKKVIITITY